MNYNPNRFVTLVLLAWLCFGIGLADWFRNVSAPAVAATVWTLTTIVLLACWKIGPIKAWAVHVDLRWLVFFHVTRFVGVYLLVLCRRGELPCAFATPAGIGDIAVAIAALILLFIPQMRAWQTLLRIWNFFGFIDIIFVVFSALRFGLRDWQSMHALRELPLSLLPTFVVPLIIASHILIFIRLASLTGISSD